MATRWTPTTLGNLLSFSNGGSSPERAGDLPHPVYGSNGILGFSDKTNAPPGTIIIGRVGSYCGSLHFSNRHCWVTDNAIRARPLEGNDARFLFYLLRSLHLNHWSGGSGQPLLNQAVLSSIPATVPGHAEQRAIGRLLGTLDDKIELNRRMNETLHAMARAVFKRWIAGRHPGRGPIPGRWEVKPLDRIATFLNGLALQRFPPVDGNHLPVIKIAELRRGVTASSGRTSAALDPRYIIDDGDVIFSWSGSLEVVIWCGGKGALNQHLFKVSSGEFPRWFYYLWLLDHLPCFRSIAASRATTMGHIQRRHLTEALCLVPPAGVLQEMTRIVAPLVDRQVESSRESRKIAALRDALLPGLISGELRVQ